MTKEETEDRYILSRGGGIDGVGFKLVVSFITANIEQDVGQNKLLRRDSEEGCGKGNREVDGGQPHRYSRRG